MLRVNVRTILMSVVAFTAMASAARAEIIFGMTSTFNLVNFDSATPGTINTIGAIGPVNAGETLRAIDFRPATGQLYAVSTNAGGTAGTMYTVDTLTGATTIVGAAGAMAFGTNNSNLISMDFNPVSGGLRVITGAASATLNNNFRFSPVTGLQAGIDGSLVYAPGDPNAGGVASWRAVAYTNNFAGAAQTTPYCYDFSNDRIATLGSVNGVPNSPNSGLMSTVGASGAVVFEGLGMDISGTTGICYLNGTIGGVSQLHTVDLATGLLSPTLGAFGVSMLDISVTPVPEPSSMILVGLGAAAFGRRYLRRKKA